MNPTAWEPRGRQSSGTLSPEGSRGRGVEVVNNGGPASRDPPPTRRASHAAAPGPGDVAYRGLDPKSVPRNPGPASSPLPASQRIGPALGGLTTIPSTPKAPENRGLGTHPTGEGEDAQDGPHGDAGAETHRSERHPARCLNCRLRCRLRNATISQAGNRARPSPDAQGTSSSGPAHGPGGRKAEPST